MIYLIYGKDDFRSESRLKEIISFYQKNNPLILIYDFKEEENKNISLNEIKNILLSKSLFVSTKLIVFKNLISVLEDNFLNKLQEILEKEKIEEAKDSLVIFYEREDLKINKLSQWLKKNSLKKEEFLPLKEKEITGWLEGEEKKLKLNLSKEARDLLILSFNSDTRSLYNSLFKLSLLKKGYLDRKFLEENLDLPIKTNIFKFLDSLAQKNIKQSLKLLNEEIEGGSHPLYVLKMIVNQFRNLIKIKISKSSHLKITPEGLKIHPYVYRKLSLLVNSFSLEGLKKIYRQLLIYDRKIKDGSLNPEIALELFLLDLKNIK